VLAVSFLLFASQNAPPLYAMGFGGDYRLRNIVYYSFIWLLFGNVFYVLGWVCKRFEVRSLVEWKCRVKCLPPVAALVLVFLLGYGTSNARASIIDLQNGLPRQFLTEHNARRELLTDTTRPVVELPAFTAFPATLLPWHDGVGFTDVILTLSPYGWRNQMVAAYYNKEAVVGLPAVYETASVRQVYISYEERVVRLMAFSINYQHFFRLRDFGYALYDVFDVRFIGGTWALMPNQRYVAVGGEASLIHGGLARESAVLYDGGLLFDGVHKDALGYVIRGEVFFRLQDITALIGMQAGWVDGYIRIN